MSVTPAVLRDLHTRMIRIRLFEEEAGRLSANGSLPGFLHLYVGQEAVAAGVMVALREDDQITSTHRGHGHIVAKGGDLRRMFAELYGRSTGYCKGKGGSMHICAMELGVLGANGIVGGGIPIAVGAAFASRYLGLDRIAVSFFGDGASNIGAFHEACNMAAVLDAPVLFVCENNHYGEYTAQHRHQRITHVSDRAAGYGFKGVRVDGMDAEAVYEATSEAVAEVRKGKGPIMLEADTYRYFDHHGIKGLGRIPYRAAEEVEQWKARDAIDAIEAKLVTRKVLSRKKIDEVWAEQRQNIAEAVAQAEADPPASPDDLLTDVYTVSASSNTGAV